MKKRILFIINPVSGNNTATSVKGIVEKYLDQKQFDWHFEYTKRPNHASEIAKDAVENNIDIVVAVGGDGMVNEVFKSLVHSNTGFSIIPKGSGNGVARSLGIPMNAAKAIKRLNSGSYITMDTGLFNNNYFLGIAGIGFDGIISALFAHKKKRGLSGYVKLIASKLLAYAPQHYSITIDNKQVEHKAFIVAFANTQQYGNNAYIAPHARYDDGKLNLIVIKEFSKWLIPFVALRIMTKAINKSRYIKSYETSQVKVTTNARFAHVDGEPIDNPAISEIKIIPNSLKVYL